MGTRADFYAGKNADAEWLGSIAWDGYRDGIPRAILDAKSEEEFCSAVATFIAERDDGTAPDRGWPWPWDNSATTDCSYWFFDGQTHDEVGGSYCPVSRAIESDVDYDAAKADGETIQFPDMRDRKNVRLDEGSGLIFVASV